MAHYGDVARFRQRLAHARQQLKRAKDLAPVNPRVVGVEADPAHGALQLQPEWFYVREILLPQIEGARRKAAGS